MNDTPEHAADKSARPQAVPVRKTWGALPQAVKPLVHSWSSIQQYEVCPHRFYWTHVVDKDQRMREPQSTQMNDGQATHRALELAVRDGIPLLEKYEQHKPTVDAIRNAQGLKMIEAQFGITRNWTACGFFEDGVWIRGKIDVAVVGTKGAAAFDYKTGNRKEDSGQLMLTAGALWAKYPMLEFVQTAFIWLPEKPPNNMTKETYKTGDLPHIKELFSFRIARIEDANRRGHWPKMPGGLCSWCPVGRDKCEYWRAYKGIPK